MNNDDSNDSILIGLALVLIPFLMMACVIIFSD